MSGPEDKREGKDPRPQAGAAADAQDGPSPLATRLGIGVGRRVVLADAPPTFRRLLGIIPAGVKLTVASGAPAGAGADVIVCFPRSLGDFSRRLPAFRAGLARTGTLWVVIPKEPVARAHRSDLLYEDVTRTARETGLTESATLDIDEDALGIELVLASEERSPRKSATRAKPGRDRLKGPARAK